VKLTIIGSADAFNGAGRGHSCYLVEGGEGPVMVDFGATALSSLKRWGRRPEEVRGLLFTHLHGDHIGGLPFLIIDAMFRASRSEPLDVLGPVGTQERIESLLQLTYGPVADFPRRYETQIREIRPDQRVEWLGLQVEAFAADHMDPPEVPLCLRVSNAEGTVAFSGDTSMCAGLRAAIEGVDLAIVECTGLRHPIGRHCAWTDWAPILHELNARQLVFSHLGEEVRAAAERGELTAPPDRPIAFADDGMVFRVPFGDDRR
jgi:ribonuclease BN (tRNA processing enzyme)